MAVDQFVCAEALVFKPEPVKRTAVLGCLRELGFQKINQASSFDELNALLQSSSPDILVCASDYADEDLIKLVQSLREGKVALNPFMIVLTLSWCSDDETVTAYRNAGVDGFLSLPVSAPTLGDFLKAQIQKRKKFVATSDYVGPDRRRDPARSGAECFKVANSLRLKILGAEEDNIGSQFAMALQESLVLLNDSRRRADAVQLCIEWRLLERCRSGSPDSKSHLCRLRSLAKDIESRAARGLENIARHHCRMISDATTLIEAGSEKTSAGEPDGSAGYNSDIERLGRAVFSLAELFAPESTTPRTSPELDELAARIDIRRNRPIFSAEPLSLTG
jgi:DNA-binding response OmpR family regulator